MDKPTGTKWLEGVLTVDVVCLSYTNAAYARPDVINVVYALCSGSAVITTIRKDQ